MFLNLLDSDEKRAFAELAEMMIKADGLVIGREESAVASLKAEMGITDTSSGRSVEELAGIFGNWRSKIAALLELVGLGYSDINYSVSEQSLVDAAAKAMGVTEEELAEVEAWVREHVSLVRRALILMRD